MTRARLLVIGLDSADPGLLTRWMDDGSLPVLRALRERGRGGALASPPGLADDGTWASFYTGASPAAHGRYFFHAIEPGSYETPYWSEERLQRRPFWESLSSAGKRIAVIDVPKCPLTHGINGVHVTDWRVHGRDRGTASQPADVAERLQSRFGEDGTDCLKQEPWLCDDRFLAVHDYSAFLSGLDRSIDDKLQFAGELLERESWDLFLAVFKEAHCAGHKLWHLIDPAHPAYDAGQAARHGDALKAVYRRLDRAVGELVDAAGPAANVLVFSGLGMASNYTGNYLLDEILQRLESRRLSLAGRIRRRARWLATRIRRGKSGRRMADRARRHRLFFPLQHGEQAGAVRLNVAGREPHGLIEPGDDYRATLNFLAEELLRLVDPATGDPLVDDVLRSDTVYAGPHTDRLPDLFVRWRRDGPISAAASPLIGEVRAAMPDLRAGGHVADGWYCLAGPDVAAQRRPLPAAITDLAPTIARLLGQSLPDVDGRPIPLEDRVAVTIRRKRATR